VRVSCLPSFPADTNLSVGYFEGVRPSRDGKRQRLEDLLNDFIAAAVVYAAAQKARTEEHERLQREWQEQERRNIERQQQIERNKRRWEFLSDRIEALERAEKIDRFLHHLRKNLSETQQVGAHVRELIDWAERYAASMRKACTASEIDRVLGDTDLFRPPT
jgi:DNA repair exonuclease SbcCD ATPase subunit